MGGMKGEMLGPKQAHTGIFEISIMVSQKQLVVLQRTAFSEVH
jgi:hypothetical protein